MGVDGDTVKLQQQSSGIIFDNYQGKWITCVYEEEGIVNKEEKYIFRCSADKACCGRECCIPTPAGIPLWLLILILVLVFLLALLLLALIIYLCWKYCRRKQVVVKKPVPVQPPPKVEIYKKPIPTLDRYEKLNKDWSLNHYHNKVKNGTAKSKKREIITVLTDLESSLDTHLEPDRSTEPISSDHELETLPPSQPSTVNEKRIDVKTRRLLAGKEPPAVVKQPIHVQQPPPTPPFTPSHMEETFENPPTPIPVSYHEESEISTEKRPLLNRLERPEEQKAQMMYYRPFVPSPMEETTLPPPLRAQASFHHSSEFTKEQHAVVSQVDLGEQKKPQIMYTRPGQDKVAAY